MTSDYAKSFFKNDQTEKSRDHGAVTGRGFAVRVRSAVVSSQNYHITVRMLNVAVSIRARLKTWEDPALFVSYATILN